MRLATTTLAPFSFPPYASAFPAPPAPITTNNLPANREPDVLLEPFKAARKLYIVVIQPTKIAWSMNIFFLKG